MNHLFRRDGGGAAFIGVLVAAWGCSDEETGLFIQGNVRVEAPQCVARAESDTTLLGGGTLDVALRQDYDASLLVGSQLTPRGDKPNLRTETMIVTITGAEVHLFDDVGSVVENGAFTVPASGTIGPEGSAEPGFGIINVTLIPPAVGTALRGELTSRLDIRTRIAQVRVFGETLGGLEVESADITYVIRVCQGCLVSFPANALGSTFECSVPTEQNIAAPCRFGQDDAVDCRLCQASNLYCRIPGEVQ